MQWSDEDEATLRRLWSENVSASDIGEEIGVSRNAVVSKAKRLGLTSSESPLPTAGAPIDDPIFLVDGASTTIGALQRWRWPGGGKHYISRDITRALDLASAIAAARSEERPEVTSVDLVSAALAMPFKPNPSRFLSKVARHLSDAGIDVSRSASLPAQLAGRKRPDALLRWDAVAIMIETARIRSRTMVYSGASDYCHLMGALLVNPLGQRAVREALKDSQSSEAFRRAVAAMLADLSLRRGDVAAWRAEIARIDSVPEIPGQRRAGYASDRVRTGGDVFGTSADARALADLILLEAAEPPLAIGVFGSWGSGKSTLIAELKQEIDRQIELAPAREDDGASGDAVLARVTGVMQLEFNAWTFADSENLWASLTAELFDQIAAGGGGAQRDAERGALLVKEVGMDGADRVAVILRRPFQDDVERLVELLDGVGLVGLPLLDVG